MRIYNCEQMRQIEKKANEGGMSYIRMMENAGKACAAKISKIIDDFDGSICIVCGNGKNGGDGFVIARYLHKRGYNVSVVLASGQPKAQEAVEMFTHIKDKIRICDATTDSAKDLISDSDYIVDCIFGIGFKGTVRDELAQLLKYINSLNKTVIAVDIPSGLEGDSGEYNGEHLKADHTLAISCKKPVHVLKPAAELCGEVSVIDIGFSKDCYDIQGGCAFFSIDSAFVKQYLPKRPAESNKGTYGKLLCVCGSRNMQGAAVMCAQAAVNSGVGLVYCAFPDKAYNAIAAKLTEPLMLPLPDDEQGFLSFEAKSELVEMLNKSNAAVIGCGLGQTQDVEKIVFSMLENANCPLIIDADGINAISSNINVLKTAKAPIVLTPHPGEMSRLTGLSVEQIQSNRLEIAKSFAKMSNCIVVLKGNNSVIASPDGFCCLNPTGNAGMAKGGSGDVLAGIIASLCAQGMRPFNAAVCGAYIHGLCGDVLATELSKVGVTPTLMIDYLPELFSNFEN